MQQLDNGFMVELIGGAENPKRNRFQLAKAATSIEEVLEIVTVFLKSEG